jgi:hypothetical protein
MFPIRTKRTNITRRSVDETVPDHFIFPLEALSAFAAGTVSYRAEMRASLGVDVVVGTGKIYISISKYI